MQFDFLHFSLYSKILDKTVNFYRLNHADENGKGKIYSDLLPSDEHGFLHATGRNFNLDDQEGFEIVSAGCIKDLLSDPLELELAKKNSDAQTLTLLNKKVENVLNADKSSDFLICFNDFLCGFNKDGKPIHLDCDEREQSVNYQEQLFDFCTYIFNNLAKIKTLEKQNYNEVCFSYFNNSEHLSCEDKMNLHSLAIKNRPLIVFNVLSNYLFSKLDLLNKYEDELNFIDSIKGQMNGTVINRAVKSTLKTAYAVNVNIALENYPKNMEYFLDSLLLRSVVSSSGFIDNLIAKDSQHSDLYKTNDFKRTLLNRLVFEPKDGLDIALFKTEKEFNKLRDDKLSIDKLENSTCKIF